MTSFQPFEVTAVHIIYVGLGTFIVLFGMFSLFIKEKLYLGEAPIAAIFGIIVGPVALNLFSPSEWANNHTETPGGHITNEITLEIMRVTIALSVFAVGVELPKKYLLRHWRSIALLLGPVMVWGWLITAAFMYALIPGLDFLNCLVVASCVTPTDPILAQAVVGGPWAEKHVPAHLRHMLMCESGCNDGAAFPFLYLALFLTLNRDNHGKAIAEWFYDAWAYQIIFGTLLGALIGWAARKLMRFSERHRLVDRESFVAQYVSLAIASMGVNVLLGSDDLLAAFACGSAFAWDGWFTRQTEDSNFSSIVDLLFNVATFIYIGALMPFRQFAGGAAEEPNTLSIWRLFVLAICVLLTKRIPIVIALWRWIPDIKTFREAIFAGHFGPIGVGAIFIATLARTQLPEEVNSPPETTNDILALTVQPVIFFFVLCSIIIHGLTIPFFAFSRRATTMTRTWSRNPSFMAGDSEPAWMSKFRKTKTGESLAGEEGNMTEIERVLNAQLTKIGRGAIGGDAEKELRRGDSDVTEDESSNTARGTESDQSRINLFNARTEREMQLANDDFEEEHGMEKEDPMGEWGGEDCIEVKRYRQRIKERKEREYAELRRKQQDSDEKKQQSSEEKQRDSQEADLGMGHYNEKVDDEDEERAPMDRDLNQGKIDPSEEDVEVRRDKEGQARWGCGTDDSEEREHAMITKERDAETCYPRSRTWVEGSKLVIEYQSTKSCDPEVTVIPLMEHERETVGNAEDPAHAWAQAHAEKIEHYLGLTDVPSWSPAESANHLMHHRIPHLYNDYLNRKMKRRETNADDENKEDRDRRSQLLYNSLHWAAEHRHDEDEDRPARTSVLRDSHEAPLRQPSGSLSFIEPQQRMPARNKKPKRPASPEDEPPVTGWLAPPPPGMARAPKPRKPTRRSTSSSTSPSRGASTSSVSIKKYISRPSASDSRRVMLRNKVCAGELSLCKGRSKTDSSSEDLINENPAPRFVGSSRRPASLASTTSSSSTYMPRTSSAGGLSMTAMRPSSTSGRPQQVSSSSSSFLQVPRTNTIESTQSEASDPGRRKHRKSSSVQWLDVGDSNQERLAQTSNEAEANTSQPRLPAQHGEQIDLARVGGGITPRTGSRNPSPTRKPDRPTASQDDAGLREGQASHGEGAGHRGSRRRSRFISILSSIGAPSHPSHSHSSRSNAKPSKLDSGLLQSRTPPNAEENQMSQQSRVASFLTPQADHAEGGILAPPSRSATGNSATADGDGAAEGSQRTTGHSTPTPGVTFNL